MSIRRRTLVERHPLVRPLIAAAMLGVLCADASAQSVPSPQFPKRGWGGSAARGPSDVMNTNWYYNWGRTPNAGAYAEFVPMAWSASSITNSTSFAQLQGHSSEYILGFNEPERTEQANMTVAQAIALWPQLMAIPGKKLVSPAVGSDALGRAWIAEFMSEATRLNYRVDAIAMHWYGDVRSTNAYTGFLNTVDSFHNTYTLNGQKLPIWITEFAGIDWYNDPANPVTQEDNRRFLAGALPGLDSRAHVQRYAWFNWRDEALLGTGTPYTPTTGGDLYNGRTYATGTSVTLAGNEGTDTFYMRGGTIAGTGTTKSIRFADFIEGSSRVQGDGNLDVRNGWVRVRAGATLGKWQANNLTLAGINVYNDGAISGKQGFIVIADGTVVDGVGYIRTEWNADATPEGITLTESTPGLGGTTINNRIWLNGGQYQVLAGSHTHNGELTLSSNSFANVTGNLTMNGPMTGAGTLGKTGTGTLRLNSTLSTNTGAFSVSAGTLMVGNETGSAHGLGTLTIGANGTLSGNGTLGGTSVTVNGTLAPSKVTDRPRAMKFTSPLTFGANARAVMDVGLITPDSVESTTAVSLDGTLQLVPNILPADLVPMPLFTASSIVGRFDAVEGVQAVGTPARSLAVTYTGTTVVVTKTLPGDANVNGIVNFDDLLLLASNYNGTAQTWAGGDFTGDGTVNFDDLLILASQYNTSLLGAIGTLSAPGAFTLVPEPVAILWVPAIALITRRRR
jgi:autotransporter-associated beta strand protein